MQLTWFQADELLNTLSNISQCLSWISGALILVTIFLLLACILYIFQIGRHSTRLKYENKLLEVLASKEPAATKGKFWDRPPNAKAE